MIAGFRRGQPSAVAGPSWRRQCQPGTVGVERAADARGQWRAALARRARARPGSRWRLAAASRSRACPGISVDYVFTRVVGGWSAQPRHRWPCMLLTCAGPPLPNYFIADGSPRAARIAPGYEVAASDRSGAVWLITFQRSGADITTAPALAQEVTTAGRPLGPRYRLPAGYLIRRALGGDLLLAPVVRGPSGTGDLQALGSSHPTRRPHLQRRHRGWPASDRLGTRSACTAPCTCSACWPGRPTTIPLPRSAWAAPNQGTFSADDRYLAFPLWAGTAPDGEPALTRIAVIDLASPHLLIVPGSALSWDVNKGVLTFGWQPAGHRADCRAA